MFNNDDDNIMSLAEHFGYAQPRPGKETPELITNDCIGVEIELENADHMRVPDGWDQHTDGSLRDNGTEFTFRGAKSGIDALTAIKNYTAALQTPHTLRRKPTLSARTSMHVHVDCTDLNTQELMDMFMVYVIFEYPLFKAFARHRMNNHFAHAVQDCLDFVDLPRSLHAGFEQFAKNVNIPNIGRYSALNIKSLFKFGTLEFRHMQATFSEEEILRWVNACLSFKRAGRARLNIPEMFFYNSAEGFMAQARQIFPRDVVEVLRGAYKTELEFNIDVIRGIRWAQNAVM